MGFTRDIILSSGDFTLVRETGTSIHDVPWDGLNIISKGIAEKHIINIRLDSVMLSDEYDENDKILPTRYICKPEGIEVSHGMRMKRDTLDETLEYAQALVQAVEFAKLVQNWLKMHDEWTNRAAARKDRIELYEKGEG